MNKNCSENIRIAERHVVLITPEVHWNTGNIGRTCLGVGAALHLVRPLGFSLSDRHVKRAGLDYWPRVNLSVWDNFGHFLEKMQPGPGEIALFAKKGSKSFRDMARPERLFLVFGSETGGLPGDLLNCYPETIYHIPVSGAIRCLNLSTSVGIALYESLRDYPVIHDWS